MSYRLTIQLVTKIILWIAFWALLVMLSAPLMAAASSDTRSSKSISFTDSAVTDNASKDELLKQIDADVMAPLLKQGFRVESLAVGVSTENVVITMLVK